VERRAVNHLSLTDAGHFISSRLKIKQAQDRIVCGNCGRSRVIARWSLAGLGGCICPGCGCFIRRRNVKEDGGHEKA